MSELNGRLAHGYTPTLTRLHPHLNTKSTGLAQVFGQTSGLYNRDPYYRDPVYNRDPYYRDPVKMLGQLCKIGPPLWISRSSEA
jgi:hypothetical protein